MNARNMKYKQFQIVLRTYFWDCHKSIIISSNKVNLPDCNSQLKRKIVLDTVALKENWGGRVYNVVHGLQGDGRVYTVMHGLQWGLKGLHCNAWSTRLLYTKVIVYVQVTMETGLVKQLLWSVLKSIRKWCKFII